MFAGFDDFVEEIGHFGVVGWVAEVFFDDFAADIVFDGFGDGFLIAADALGKFIDRLIDSDFGDDFEQGHGVEGRDFAGFAGFDVGVD